MLKYFSLIEFVISPGFPSPITDWLIFITGITKVPAPVINASSESIASSTPKGSSLTVKSNNLAISNTVDLVVPGRISEAVSYTHLTLPKNREV